MRCFSSGYSASFERKKQYLQSMLQVDPLGLASRWNPGGASTGRVCSSMALVGASHVQGCILPRQDSRATPGRPVDLGPMALLARLHTRRQGLVHVVALRCADSVKWKVAPPLPLDDAHRRPPCAATICRQTARPRPRPCGLVVKNGS